MPVLIVASAKLTQRVVNLCINYRLSPTSRNSCPIVSIVKFVSTAIILVDAAAIVGTLVVGAVLAVTTAVDRTEICRRIKILLQGLRSRRKPQWGLDLHLLNKLLRRMIPRCRQTEGGRIWDTFLPIYWSFFGTRRSSDRWVSGSRKPDGSVG